MSPTGGALTLSGLVVMAFATFACERTPALEAVPPGTDVTIEMQDGRRVTGALVNVDPDTVVVSRDRANGQIDGTDGEISVARSRIADVQSGPGAALSRAPLREAKVPAGSTLDARLDTAVASDASRIEEPIEASLTTPLVADGVTIAPAGSTLLGTVTAVRESGRVRGRAALGIRFDRLRTDDVTYDIRTAPMRWTAEATKGQDAAKVGIGAATGAVIGAITGGGKGAAVGSAVGAGGGSAVVLATKGKEIRLGSGTRLRVKLTAPISVLVPAAGD